MFSYSNSSRRIRGTRNISHRRFHLHSFSRQGRAGPIESTTPGVRFTGCFTARAPLDFDFRSRAKRRVLKVSPDNNDKRSSSQRELFVSRSPRRGDAHGNAGVKSTTGTNLTYLVIGLTPSADTRDLLNNDDDAFGEATARMTLR